MNSDLITVRKTVEAERGTTADEQWELCRSERCSTWQVAARYHKPADILALKSDIVGDFAAAVKRIRSERKTLFGDAAKVDKVATCPVCDAPASSAERQCEVYGAVYVKCARCTHRYVVNRLSQAALEEFYRSNTGYQAIYADPERARLRVEQIQKPKLDWLLEQFNRIHGRRPRAILDVGAGSGHFCVAAREAGIPCHGIELSESGRAFARQVFGIELEACDFIEQVSRYEGRYDVVTFWGLIEHVPDPVGMLAAGKRVTAPGGAPLLVASVPRWSSLSSFIQQFYPERIVRHLDPLGHIQCFTDTSACAAVDRAGLQIAGAWYFGMDAYETLLQLATESSPSLLNRALIDGLQRTLDEAALSDSLVFCARAPDSVK